MLTKIEIPVRSSLEWEQHKTALEQAPSLAAMVLKVLFLLRYLGQCLLEHELDRRQSAKPHPKSHCPHCGRALESKGQHPRRITTLVGVIH